MCFLQWSLLISAASSNPLEIEPDDNDDDSDGGDSDVHPGEHGMHAGLPASQSSRTPVHDGFDQLPATVHCPALVAARSPSVAPPVTHRRRLPNAYATPPGAVIGAATRLPIFGVLHWNNGHRQTDRRTQQLDSRIILCL